VTADPADDVLLECLQRGAFDYFLHWFDC